MLNSFASMVDIALISKFSMVATCATTNRNHVRRQAMQCCYLTSYKLANLLLTFWPAAEEQAVSCRDSSSSSSSSHIISSDVMKETSSSKESKEEEKPEEKLPPETAAC